MESLRWRREPEEVRIRQKCTIFLVQSDLPRKHSQYRTRSPTNFGQRVLRS